MQENLLARFSILNELGRGATGAVYAARDRTTGAVVALKRLDPASLKSDATLAQRFLKHARSARALKHRNIVETYDAGEAAGTAYVAMEMLEGESLRKILDEGPLPVARALRIAHDIASGLAHAHLEGAVHGGLTASNIIVLRSGAAKITDFGTSQAALQARGGPADHRSDVLALGALFYEMLTRQPPVAGGSPPPPSELNRNVPRALDAIVLSMLASQPADRMAGVPILLRELERLEDGLGLGSGATPAMDEPAREVPGFGFRTEPSPGDAFQNRPLTDHEEFDYRRAMMERESRRDRSSGSRTAIVAALAFLAVLGIGYGGFMYYSSHPGKLDVAASRVKDVLAASGMTAPPAEPASASASAPAPVPAATPAPEPVATPAPPPVPAPAPAPVVTQPGTLFGLKVPSKPIAAEPDPLPKTQIPVARAAEPPPSARPAPAKALPRAKPAAAKVAAPPPVRMAQLILTVSPRGEIYIDGEHYGTTPPVTDFELAPGMHRIEVRSGTRKPYVTYMTVEAGDVRRVRHDFDAKPSRPPS